jgi:hypothetical protein
MATPVTVDRLTQELERLKSEMDAGKLKHGEYDQRLGRIIQELRENKVDADRPRLKTMLDDLSARGVITPAVRTHLEKKLGLS